MRTGLATLILFFSGYLLSYGQDQPTDQPDADGRIIRGRNNSPFWKPYMAEADLGVYQHASPEAVESFKDLKYGLRIHWGIYSMVHGKESWVIPEVLRNDPVKLAWYHNLYQGWYPDAFDADGWMEMARDWGFSFFVFTTKHHDGFSMYDTKYKVKLREAFTGENIGEMEDCDHHYSIMETPFSRDVTRELVDAGRKNGLKVGLYFSHPDWYDGDFRFKKPGEDTSYTPAAFPEDFSRFKKRHSGQIEELLTNYGNIDILSLDMWLTPFTWDHMKKTISMARDLQPDVMMRWRGIGNYGDYQTPENVIPGDADMGTMPWQVIHTLSKRRIFSYEPDENYLRDGQWIVETLVDVVSKGGNFMVGVGPDIRGNWHPKVVEALDEAGNWLEIYGEAIYGTRPWTSYGQGPVKDAEKSSGGQNRDESMVFSDRDFRFTQKGPYLYVFQYGDPDPGTDIVLKDLKSKGHKILGVHDLATNMEMKWELGKEGLELTVPGRTADLVNVYKVHLK